MIQKEDENKDQSTTPAMTIGQAELLEVFLCVADASRPEYTKQTTEYWLRQHLKKEVELTIVIPVGKMEEVGKVVGEMIGGTGVRLVRVGFGEFGESNKPDTNLDHDSSYARFQRGRRVWAQKLAKRKWYVVADDDCIPTEESFYKEAIRIIKRHPKAKEFGVLVAWPTNAKIYPWRPYKDEMVRNEVYMDSEIWEHVSVGGIRFVQKAAHSEDEDGWVEQPGMSEDGKYRYDREEADMLRKRGWRSGLMRGVGMIHLGERERHDDSGHPEHPTEPDFQV